MPWLIFLHSLFLLRLKFCIRYHRLGSYRPQWQGLTRLLYFHNIPRFLEFVIFRFKYWFLTLYWIFFCQRNQTLVILLYKFWVKLAILDIVLVNIAALSKGLSYRRSLDRELICRQFLMICSHPSWFRLRDKVCLWWYTTWLLLKVRLCYGCYWIML